MEKEIINSLFKKQKGLCAFCGASLQEFGAMLSEDQLVCNDCFELEHTNAEKISENRVIMLRSEDKAKKTEEEIPDSNKITLKFKNVFDWASHLTCEQDPTESLQDFYWTKEARRLLRRLQYGNTQLIAVVGLQGSGKTATRVALENQLFSENRKGISTKWLDLRELMANYKTRAQDPKFIKSEIEIREEMLAKLGKSKSFETMHREWIFQHISPWDYLDFLDKKLGKHEEIHGFILNISDWNVLLLDLPDYTKRTTTAMNRDLSAIQELWEKIRELNPETMMNIVLFLQKELFHGHFFFGKCDVFELKPLTPEELCDFYKNRFGSYEPFTVEALKETAYLSWGIFRRFKKYVLICLENYYDEETKGAITLENVREWITLEQLAKDMELQLWDLFPKSPGLIKKSVILLRYLREHGPTTQTALTNELFEGYKMGCSRLLGKLESASDFIVCEKKGKEKIWSLRG